VKDTGQKLSLLCICQSLADFRKYVRQGNFEKLLATINRVSISCRMRRINACFLTDHCCLPVNEVLSQRKGTGQLDCDRNCETANSIIGRVRLLIVEQFKYLGQPWRIKISFMKKLRTVWRQGMLAIIECSLVSKSVNTEIHRTIILPLGFCQCETWSLALREECRLSFRK
jgi:hypothetical protein